MKTVNYDKRRDNLYELYNKILSKISDAGKYKALLEDTFCYMFEAEMLSGCNDDFLLEKLENYLYILCN